ncbi:hypothetical protein E2542_SST12443 [Spatholobus suberectus]|nr:hypothetical protein E2542_SST12443 [Spatholobus suberectus]
MIRLVGVLKVVIFLAALVVFETVVDCSFGRSLLDIGSVNCSVEVCLCCRGLVAMVWLQSLVLLEIEDVCGRNCGRVDSKSLDVVAEIMVTDYFKTLGLMLTI